jgi:hypothetical protein
MFDSFGVLALANKYMISRLRSQLLRHICTVWTQTLEAHDVMVDRALGQESVDGLSYPFVHPLHVLKVSRSINARALMPSALYFLSMYPLADLLQGEHPKLQTKHAGAPSKDLGSEDILDYTLMYQHRMDVLLDFTRTLRTTPYPGCNSLLSTQCQRGLKHLESRFSRSWNARSSPLFFMKQAIQTIEDNPSVCQSCKRAFRSDMNDLREKTWQGLPTVVRLPPWEDLIKELEE